MNRKMGGSFMDVIRCDEPDYLIWKWHPQGTELGKNRKENQIRWGSSLRVKTGSVAVFVYKQKDGTFQDYIEGPFDQTIKTSNFPVLARIVGLPFGGDSPFQAEIYFINLAKIIQTRFSVPYFDVFDVDNATFSVPIAVRGTITFSITDYKDFLKLHRLDSFDLDAFKTQISDSVARYVKSSVAGAPLKYNTPVISIERAISDINHDVEIEVRNRLYDDFGVTVSGLDIAVLDIDKSSDGYKELIEVTRALDAKKRKATTEIEIKEMFDAQRLSVREREIGLEEDQYARHKGTQSGNLAAFQTEAAMEVGKEGAKGLGMMGSGGGIDGGGNGFNPASLMAQMAVGGVIGQNIAQSMNNTMGNINEINSQVPPIPQESYSVVSNGQSVGPFNLTTILQMIAAGMIVETTLLWKSGFDSWVSAGELTEFKGKFKQE